MHAGTLTLNKLSVELKSVMCVTEGYSIMDVMKYAALSTNTVTEEPIDMVLYNSYPEQVSSRAGGSLAVDGTAAAAAGCVVSWFCWHGPTFGCPHGTGILQLSEGWSK